MTDPTYYGSLVAYRGSRADLEVLLVRRPFRAWPSCESLEYPGEVMFPFDRYRQGDFAQARPSFLAAAVRAFRKELSYTGTITRYANLPPSEEIAYGESRSFNFYAAQVPDFPSAMDDSHIGFTFRWVKPREALDFITSERFAERHVQGLARLCEAHAFFQKTQPTPIQRVQSSATLKVLMHLSKHQEEYPLPEFPEL